MKIIAGSYLTEGIFFQRCCNLLLVGYFFKGKRKVVFFLIYFQVMLTNQHKVHFTNLSIQWQGY